MCGIAGIVSLNGPIDVDAAERVARMSNAIAHRGPDESGQYIDQFAVLAHRRLAIIDLSGGQQPMGSVDGKVQIVFNGEIYNFKAIRRELEVAGHVFRTQSDTEVILAAYLVWGEDSIKRLEGMFAFAIWDSRTLTLLLARDRFGKKPLYWMRRGGAIAFASELKALRASGMCPSNVNPAALDCYFSFGYIPAPMTIFEGVNKLRPARYHVFSPAGDTEQTYWSLESGEKFDGTLADATNELSRLIREAVSSRLIGEVPLGAFLSGGLDSSIVVSYMAEVSQRPVITNSIGFGLSGFSELPTAAKTAAHIKADHHEFQVNASVEEVLDKIAWHMDEPFADSSAMPTWYVCKMARQNVTVALSGDGGDEAFGGYVNRYLPHIAEARIRSWLPPSIRFLTFGALSKVWPYSAKLPRPLRLRSIFENLIRGDSEAFAHDLAWLRADARDNLYLPSFKRALNGFSPLELVIQHYLNCKSQDALSRAQFADVHFYMTDDVLTKVDRMSMAHSLEVRCPLLDHRVMEFAFTLPRHFKTHGIKGKRLLRLLAETRLPKDVLSQPKQGFAVPAAHWLRNDIRDFAKARIFGSSEIASGVLDLSKVKLLWDEHASGIRDHSVFLWGLMMLNIWETSRG